MHREVHYMKMARLRAAAAMLAAGALLLTACSSGGSSGDASSGEAPSGGPEGDAIKIGYALAQTGFASGVVGPTAEVAQAWANWVNAEGGIGGRPVEIVVRDTAATPATALTAVKQLVEQEGVVALMFGDGASESGLRDYLASSDVAVLEVQSFDPTMFSALPNFFATSTTDKYVHSGYAEAAAAAGGKSLAFAVCAEVAACTQAGEVSEELAPGLDMKYTGTVKVTGSQPSFTAECLKLNQSDTEWIGMALDFAGTGNRMASDCLQQGYTGGFVVGSGSVNGGLDEVPDAKFTGPMNGFPWWVDDAPVAQYRDVMAEFAPDVPITGTWQTSTWTGLEMFRRALAGHTVEGLTRRQVIDAYGTIKDETLGGLLPQPVTYTPGEPAPPVSCYWIYSYTGGSGEFENIQKGKSGNGLTTDLASSCYDGPPFS
ncbi:ABC transporter substrate-binding protein [Rhodococcus opacus]|nr:ABC transporter substrate-binding protein [Rhodococcus opacus]